MHTWWSGWSLITLDIKCKSVRHKVTSTLSPKPDCNKNRRFDRFWVRDLAPAQRAVGDRPPLKEIPDEGARRRRKLFFYIQIINDFFDEMCCFYRFTCSASLIISAEISQKNVLINENFEKFQRFWEKCLKYFRKFFRSKKIFVFEIFFSKKFISSKKNFFDVWCVTHHWIRN